MEGSGCKKMLAVGMCALVVLALIADADAQCSVQQMSGCTGAVVQGTPPTPLCCNQLSTANFPCFCNMLQRQRNIRQDYIAHAVRVPMGCGKQGERFRGLRCGGIVIP